MAEQHPAPPLADYEGMPIATLQHRIRSLDASELTDLIAYEREHAHRTNVLEILESRLEQLRAGAEPSGGSQSRRPESPPQPSGEPKARPDSAAPQANPPPHGVPAQPARPKGDRQPGTQ